MPTFHEAMQIYKAQLQQGAIQVAYRGLLEYMLALRVQFEKKFPELVVSGLYAGYMDMTYFSVVPEAFQQRKLKIAVVFLHQEFRFEAWLAGVNKQVQAKTWQQLKDSGWNRYPLVPSPAGADAIVTHVIAEAPDFCNLPALTRQVERETLAFLEEMGKIL